MLQRRPALSADIVNNNGRSAVFPGEKGAQRGFLRPQVIDRLTNLPIDWRGAS